jgi:hypothetical protein
MVMPEITDKSDDSVKRYRQRMRERGYRQVNIWVPNTRAPAFVKRCREESLRAARADADEGILDDLDVAADEVEGWH